MSGPGGSASQGGPAQGGPAQGRAAVIDIGSNSLRLVVYDGLGPAPFPLLNEKATCALGRGVGSTGRLNPEGVELALAAVERFAALVRAIGVVHLDVVATAAVRDAEDGPAFIDALEARCGLRPRVLSGADEGRLSALGVSSGIPDADGIAADLGGGSIELVRLEAGVPTLAETLPLGPLRLAEAMGDERRLAAAIADAMMPVRWLGAGRGRALYLVGGAFRALARLHMETAGYPLHVIQGYRVPRAAALDFLDGVPRLPPRVLERSGVSRRRVDALPAAARVLARLVVEAEPEGLVFSAYGLREGLLLDRLAPEARRADPLLAACASLARAAPRFGARADELLAFTAPLFAGEAPAALRLRHAAALLSDAFWCEHPDYRAQQAFSRILGMPAPALDHRDRVFLATALHARYGGSPEDPLRAPTRRLIDDRAAAEARILGLALRIGYTLSGGAPGILPGLRLRLEPRSLVLETPRDPLYTADIVARRLDTLARALDLRPEHRLAPA